VNSVFLGAPELAGWHHRLPDVSASKKGACR
jgi:hypothetical protein